MARVARGARAEWVDGHQGRGATHPGGPAATPRVVPPAIPGVVPPATPRVVPAATPRVAVEGERPADPLVWQPVVQPRALLGAQTRPRSSSPAM